VRDSFDLIVIGAGSAGLAAAGVANGFGARVALVERDRVGGDCTWTGCVPSKALLHVAAIAQQAKTSSSMGVSSDNVRIDFNQVMRHVHAVIERVYAHETPQVLEQSGIRVVTGQARFLDPHTIDVDGVTLRARRFILCTGSRPAIPAIAGLDGVACLTSSNVFDLAELPGRLIVLGGGAIGVELSQAFQRLGSSVTVIEAGERLLSFADPRASAVIAEALRTEGVTLRTGEVVERVVAENGCVRVMTTNGDVHGDRLLVATGRKPVVDGLELERAGVEVTEDGITVDARLRTSQKHIFAAGDVTGGPQFTHYAAWQAASATRNALLPFPTDATPRAVPWIVFSDPEVAQVGISESDARASMRAHRIIHYPAAQIDRAHTIGDQTGFITLIATRWGRLVGATVAGAGAGETINELSLAIHRRMSLLAVSQSLHAYPTWGLAIQEASGEYIIERLGRGITGGILRVMTRRW
jgi:pyruvate/2-oxoglutarate dehydrogenase complex dihydrolipoamide dehydrogenase (E3) component